MSSKIIYTCDLCGEIIKKRMHDMPSLGIRESGGDSMFIFRLEHLHKKCAERIIKCLKELRET